MEPLVTYQLDQGVATLTMDDGRVNAMSPTMISVLGAALDRAEVDGAVVVLAGRPGRFSAGFDLDVLRGSPIEAVAMVRGGMELCARLLAFPQPVVMACTGHAIAMGLFLLQCGDHRFGAGGPFKLVANEVAIGLTVPRAAVEVLRHKMLPAALDRAVGLAEVFDPQAAAVAGLLDVVVPAEEVLAAARAVAVSLLPLDRAAHLGSKLRARGPLLEAVRAGIVLDFTT